MKESNVIIIDYGSGNLLSVRRALESFGVEVKVTSSPDAVRSASRLILPGVGAFAHGMIALKKLGLDLAIHQAVSGGVPLLGICLGMQLLMEESQEHELSYGLGIIPGRVVSLPALDIHGEKLKVPHIGWGRLIPSMNENFGSSVLAGLTNTDQVYFAHSYQVVPESIDTRVAETSYGGHQILAALRKDNVSGVQFHPEKSGEIGLQILRAFVFGHS